MRLDRLHRAHPSLHPFGLAGMLMRPQSHEAKAEATTHEAEAEATTHEAEAEATTHDNAEKNEYTWLR